MYCVEEGRDRDARRFLSDTTCFTVVGVKGSSECSESTSRAPKKGRELGDGGAATHL